MSLYDKLVGNATLSNNTDYINDYLLDNEDVIMAYQFVRDSIILTNLGIYMVDVQGITGKKVQVKFFPGKAIKTISFETAGNFDLDVDIKIGVEGNTVVNQQGIYHSAPISFKVPKSQSKQAKEIVNLIKKYYLT